MAVEDWIVGALHLLDDPQLPGLTQLHLVNLRKTSLAKQLEEAVVGVWIRDVEFFDHLGVGKTDVTARDCFILVRAHLINMFIFTNR